MKLTPFQISLGVTTLIIAGGVLGFGIVNQMSYSKNKAKFQADSSALLKMESMKGYPNQENIDILQAELKDYDTDLKKAAEYLKPFEIASFSNSSTSAFASELKAASQNVAKQFEENGIGLPEDWYLGFEKYSSVPAPKNATGALSYQLGAIKFLHEQLVAVNASELLNLRRSAIAQEGEQEKSNARKPKGIEVTKMPLEISFVASEAGARQFLNELVAVNNYLFTVNTLKLKTKSVEYADKASAEKSDSPSDSEVVSFIFDEEEMEVDQSSQNEKLFEQVLGQEQVEVFLSLNVVYLTK